jgi:hypothetical protein
MTKAFLMWQMRSCGYERIGKLNGLSFCIQFPRFSFSTIIRQLADHIKKNYVFSLLCVLL